jgi:hypothetical protein
MRRPRRPEVCASEIHRGAALQCSPRFKPRSDPAASMRTLAIAQISDSIGTSPVVALETAPPAQRSAFICANLYNLWIRPGDGHGYRIQLATRTTDALPLRGRRAAGAVRFCDQHQPLHRLDASASASKFRRHRCRFATSARVLLSSRNRMFALYTHGV